jgi:tRNA(Ile)-lysidine synthase
MYFCGVIYRFKLNIDKKFKKFRTQKLLLAMSGGLDSMVLLHLLSQCKLDFGVAHCNFGLRADDSDADAKFVEEICTKNRIPFEIKKFKTKAHSQKHKISTQMAARELRYSWFEEILEKKNYDKIITAHHLDDQLETFMINTARGSGLSGLIGIPENNSTVVRPMLPFTRKEILEYAQAENLEWREDISNASDIYLRNALRNQVVPKWKTFEPNLMSNFGVTLSYIKQSQQALDVVVNQWKSQHFVHKGAHIHIDLKVLKKLTPQEYYLHALFSSYGFHLNDLKDLLSAQSGKHLQSSSYRLLANRGEWILTEHNFSPISEVLWDLTKPLDHPIKLEVSSLSLNNNSCVALDQSLLILPLKLRKFQEGDYFYPTGMQGKKKLSKYFKDEKYSQIDKENQWLLCSENSIVWVIGKRADRRYTSKPTENNCLIIKAE